jgi:hypothetical protein
VKGSREQLLLGGGGGFMSVRKNDKTEGKTNLVERLELGLVYYLFVDRLKKVLVE